MCGRDGTSERYYGPVDSALGSRGCQVSPCHTCTRGPNPLALNRMLKWRALLCAVALAASPAACAGILGIQDIADDQAVAPPDAAFVEATADSTSGDDGNADGTDASLDGDAPLATDGDAADEAPPTVYNAMSAPFFATFDTTLVAARAKGYFGAGFDGRYVYLVPYYDGAYDGVVARYDTQAAFTAASSWATFDTAALGAGSAGYVGASFDGRYLYLAPYYNGTAYDGMVARYDTQATFTTLSSWSTFDTTTTPGAAKGFLGATFDGRYVYFVPNYDGTAYNGVVARYDTKATFALASSWATFDVSTVTALAKGFFGAAFDGRYVYLVPYFNGTAYHGLVARYDTQGAFNVAASWSTFDTATVGAKGFIGAAFDGRYLYLVPYYDGTAFDGVAARYDTQSAFTTAAAWSTFDTTTVNAGAKGFIGGAFDGRYLYFVPRQSAALSFNSILTRYDTQAGFTTATSWSAFDTGTVNVNARGFASAAFDGRYLYLAPSYDSVDGGLATPDGIVTRFDAKTPPSQPNLPAFHGSFL
jgi:hypothetical protein